MFSVLHLILTRCSYIRGMNFEEKSTSAWRPIFSPLGGIFIDRPNQAWQRAAATHMAVSWPFVAGSTGFEPHVSHYRQGLTAFSASNGIYVYGHLRIHSLSMNCKVTKHRVTESPSPQAPAVLTEISVVLISSKFPPNSSQFGFHISP